MNPRPWLSIKATARILPVELYLSAFYIIATCINCKFLLSGFLESRIHSQITSLIYLLIWIGQMSLDNSGANKDLRKMELQLSMSSSYADMKSINQKYAFYTAGAEQIAYPPTYQSIGSFIAKFAADHDGSSKSIANIVSAIKSMCHLIPVPWLSEDSQRQLRKIVKQIKRNDGVAISRKEPMTMMIIKKGLQNYWHWQSSSTDMLAATISLVGHNCLFRGQETFSGIQVKDVKWNLVQRIVCIHIGSPEKPGMVAQSVSGYDVSIAQVLISISSVGSMPAICGVKNSCISFHE